MGCLCVWSVAYAKAHLEDYNQEKLNNDVTSSIQGSGLYSPEPIKENNNVGRYNTRNDQHFIRSSTPGNAETLTGFLIGKKSPLAPYAGFIASSPYYSTIIGITAAEESFSINPTCQATGKPSNNLYGQMINGRIRCFDSILDGFNYESDWLARHEEKHPTIESLNGYYVQPASSNWLNTVLKIKQLIESL